MNPIVQKIANEYKTILLDLYGDNLTELVLYGSYARGEQHEESDVDFAVVLRNPATRPAAEILKTSPIASRLSLKYGLMISSLPVSFQKSKLLCKACTGISVKKVLQYDITFTQRSIESFTKAQTALHNAKYDLGGGFYLATANRAYYACYYCISALLYTQDVFAKTHQGVRSRFSELFIKTEIFPVHISDTIALLFDYRQQADYDLDADITPEEAANLIVKAIDFLQLTQGYFEQFEKQ